MIRSKHQDENKPRIRIKMFARPNTTLSGIGNPPHEFYMQDLMKTVATPCSLILYFKIVKYVNLDGK